MAAVGGYGAPPGGFPGAPGFDAANAGAFDRPGHHGHPSASDRPPAAHMTPVLVDTVVKCLTGLVPKEDPEDQCTISVFLEDVPFGYELTEEDLHNTFNDCGKIKNITWPRPDVQTQAHIIFEKATACERAISLDKYPLAEIRPGVDSRVRVVKVDPRPSQPQQLSMKYDLCPELFLGEPTFNITTLILGEGHAHMQHIMKESKNLVDIHIKGKASIQVPEEERLQIVLKSHDRGMFDVACDLLTDLLKSTCDKFLRWFIAHYPNTNPVKPQFTATRNDLIYDSNEPRQTTHVAPGWDAERLRRREQQHYDRAAAGRGPPGHAHAHAHAVRPGAHAGHHAHAARPGAHAHGHHHAHAHAHGHHHAHAHAHHHAHAPRPHHHAHGHPPAGYPNVPGMPGYRR